jgi:hypothetical protein
MPLRLVVTNGSKIDARASAAIPGPVSTTSTWTALVPRVRVRSSTLRGRSASDTASNAFARRLSTTCCSWTRSPDTSGSWGARSSVTDTFFSSASVPTTVATSLINALSRRGWRFASPVWKIARRFWITWRARWSATTMSWKISLTSSRLGSGDPMKRRPAWAFVMIAVRG